VTRTLSSIWKSLETELYDSVPDVTPPFSFPPTRKKNGCHEPTSLRSFPVPLLTRDGGSDLDVLYGLGLHGCTRAVPARMRRRAFFAGNIKVPCLVYLQRRRRQLCRCALVHVSKVGPCRRCGAYLCAEVGLRVGVREYVVFAKRGGVLSVCYPLLCRLCELATFCAGPEGGKVRWLGYSIWTDVRIRMRFCTPAFQGGDEARWFHPVLGLCIMPAVRVAVVQTRQTVVAAGVTCVWLCSEARGEVRRPSQGRPRV